MLQNLRLISALEGGKPQIESLGLTPLSTVCLTPDGIIDLLDVLNIIKDKKKSLTSIFNKKIDDIKKDPNWEYYYESTTKLHKSCNSCEYLNVCGGGYLPHRWSNANQFDNPSVYCSELKKIFSHIWNRISVDVRLVTSKGEFKLSQVTNKKLPPTLVWQYGG